MHSALLLASALECTAFAHPSPRPRARADPDCAPRTTTYISSALTSETSTVEWTYNGTSLDGPKVHPVNSTTFDWWYFDAVSSDLSSGDLSSVVITFYTASHEGFGALSNDTTILETSITGTLSDGTPFDFAKFPTEATVVTEGDGSAGVWGEGGTEWSSSPDLKHWIIKFNDPDDNVSGQMTFQTIAPAHLPCGALEVGATELLMPHIGWANAVPDALAQVNFDFNGTAPSFTGPGYHDKNWGDQPFLDSVGSWYWGHGHLGPYSIVWFDARDITGKEYFSSYVAKAGKILSGSCSNGSVIVRPWGGEDTYPPPMTTATPDGFIVTYGNVEGKEMVVNVTTATAAVEFSYVYDRWIGTLAGGFTDGSGNYTGVAQYEEFKV
ncbi:hypothetical protein LTR85_010449 [Meristemomyces frigidus]|nr:hypothetical protein LTR85_010449 [Meristemomyces frigidus]